MTIQETILTNTVTLDGSGNGSVKVGLTQASTVLAPRLGIVSTSTANNTPECILYRGSSTAPLAYIDSTFQGNGDSTGKVAGTLYYPGQFIWAVWTGGDAGATATFQVYAQQGLQSDNLQPESAGASFTANAMSPGQMTASLINSNLSNTIAAAIKAAGVPPIDNPQAVSVTFNQAVAAGATFTSPRLSIGQWQSLVGTMYIQETTGGGPGTNPYTRFTMDFSTASDNYDPLVREDWVVANGPLSFVSNYRNEIITPCYADTLTMTFKNYDSLPVQITWGLFGSYRTRSRSTLRSRWPDDYSGESTGLGSDNILMAVTTPNIPAGNNLNLGLMQLWEGPVTFNALYTGNPAARTIVCSIQPEPASVVNKTFQMTNDQTQSMTPTELILGRRPYGVTIFNQSAVTITATIMVTGQVQPM